MIPKTLKNFNLFVSGKGYAGRVSELNLPKLALKLESFRAGGMDVPMQFDMGMETLSCSFTVAEYDKDIINLFGLRDNSSANLTFRGGLDDGTTTVVPVVVNVTGMWQEVDFGGWQAGNLSQLKVSVSAVYYKLTLNNNELIEIDVLNMVRKVNGKDQLANLRKAAGI